MEGKSLRQIKALLEKEGIKTASGGNVWHEKVIQGMIMLSQEQQLKCPEPILIIIGGCQDDWNISARLFVNKQEVILDFREEKGA